MRKLICSLLAVLPLLPGLFVPAEAREYRIATVAPPGTWVDLMEEGADRIRELTDGRVSFKLRTGGIEGSDEQVLNKIRIGNLHGGAFSAGGLARVYPGLNTYSIPLMFRSLDEIDFVRARLDPKILAGLDQAGFVGLGISEGGFSNLLSREPVSHVDDLRRKKVWVPDNDPVSYRVLEALQLSPQPMAVADARMGVSSGLVDVVAASPAVALLLQWHTEVRYRTDFPISYSYGVFAMPASVFYQMEEGDQQVVRSVIGEVMQRIDSSSRQDNLDAAALMEARGVQPVAVNPADVAGWRASIEALYPELGRMRDLDPVLFAELLALLNEYRLAR